jgi:hypothetical protein
MFVSGICLTIVSTIKTILLLLNHGSMVVDRVDMDGYDLVTDKWKSITTWFFTALVSGIVNISDWVLQAIIPRMARQVDVMQVLMISGLYSLVFVICLILLCTLSTSSKAQKKHSRHHDNDDRDHRHRHHRHRGRANSQAKVAVVSVPADSPDTSSTEDN